MAERDEHSPGRELPADLQAFEAQLALLVPNAGALERDRLLFEAGRAAAEAEWTRRRPSRALHWARMGAAVAATAAATFLFTARILQPQPLAVSQPQPPVSVTPEDTSDEPAPDAPPSVRVVANQNGHMPPPAIVDSAFGSGTVGAMLSYFRQRDRLLAMGVDTLLQTKKRTPASGERSKTPVSYADLLDELTTERHGPAPDASRPVPMNPLEQGTDR